MVSKPAQITSNLRLFLQVGHVIHNIDNYVQRDLENLRGKDR